MASNCDVTVTSDNKKTLIIGLSAVATVVVLGTLYFYKMRRHKLEMALDMTAKKEGV